MCVLSSCQTVDRGNFGPFIRSLNNQPHGYQVVDDPTGKAPTKRVERFEVRPGDCASNGDWSDCEKDRERSELAEERKTVRSGEFWYGWSLYVPEEYVNIFPTKTAIGQFHQYGGHPLWMFQNGSGGYWLDQQVSGSTEQYFPLISEEDLKGRWHRLEMHVNWSSDPEKGFLAISVNGEQKVDFRGQTAENNPIYFKYGIYRSYLSRYKEDRKVNEVPAQTLYFSNVKRGLKREELKPN